MTETKLMSLQDKITHLLKNEDGQFNTLPAFNTYKSSALDVFEAKGFPTIKHEEYKYTNLLNITKEDYQFPQVSHVDNSDAVLAAHDALNAHLNTIHEDIKGENKGVYRIVFFNGAFVKELSYLPESNILEMSYLSSSQAPQLAGTLSAQSKDVFALINNGLTTDGICLTIKKYQQVDKPIHIIHLSQSEQNLWVNPRLYLHAETSSHVELIETYSHHGNGIFMSNAVTEVIIDANAKVEHYDIHKNTPAVRSVKNTFSQLAQDAHYKNYNINLPGMQFCRNNSEIFVKGQNVNSELLGLVIANNEQLVDNHTAIHHTVPHTDSFQLYKGIVMDKANLVFNGKIYVYEDAQKTNAFQQSNNLSLSPNATVNAKPQLEIFADDVKCSHGSTIGQLDESAMFYLKSRGIGETSARKMMIGAFAYDVTEKMTNTTIKHYVEKQIANALS